MVKSTLGSSISGLWSVQVLGALSSRQVFELQGSFQSFRVSRVLGFGAKKS